MIFLRINLPYCVQFKQYLGKILSVIKGLGAKPPGNAAYEKSVSHCTVSTSSVVQPIRAISRARATRRCVTDPSIDIVPYVREKSNFF